MSEEKKSAKQPAKQPTKPSAKEKQPARPEPKAEKTVHAAPIPVETKPKRLKITQMSLQEVEKALEKAKQFMGGMGSHYAQALQARKEFLTKQTVTVKYQAKAA